MNKPNFTLQPSQRQGVNEYLWLHSDQPAFDLTDGMSDADLIIMAIGIDAVLKDPDQEFIEFSF